MKKLYIYKWVRKANPTWWERLLGARVKEKVGEMDYTPKDEL